jgi:adenylyltransferase/sulfurtransferase
MSELTKAELHRYQCHLTLPGFGSEGQELLKASSVLVVGAGGLGCPALQYLAAAGVGTLGIVDNDQISRSNLQRQILYTEAEVGRLKAETAAERLRAMNPDIRCEVHPCRFTAENAFDLVRRHDVIVDGSDNFATRYLINDACVLADKPFVYGALYTMQGQASVFNFRGGPTYRCLFPEPPDPRNVPNCSEIGVIGVLPGMIGIIQATEVIKMLTGIGQPLSGKLLLLDALDMSRRIVEFDRTDAAEVSELNEQPQSCAETSAHCTSDEIAVLGLQAVLDRDGPCQLIDVREAWERELCRIDSVHCPLGPLLERRENLADYGLRPDLPTFVYCKSGVRSLRALPVLRNHYGFHDVRSLAGGILAWAERIDPSLPRY